MPWQSMEKGARVSPHIYVPKKVWYQHGAKVQAYQVKYEVFEVFYSPLGHIFDAVSQHGLLQMLQKEFISLRRDDVDGDVKVFLEVRAIGSFTILQPLYIIRLADTPAYPILDEDVQNRLAQYLSFIHSIKAPASDSVAVTC